MTYIRRLGTQFMRKNLVQNTQRKTSLASKQFSAISSTIQFKTNIKEQSKSGYKTRSAA